MASRVKPGFAVHEVLGDPVLIGVEELASWFTGMVRLNSTALCVWRGLENGLDNEAIASELVEEFDVDAASAQCDVERAVERFAAAGLLLGE